MRRSGFTLVEVVVATGVIVLVLGVLALSLRVFFRASGNLELRQDALTLAVLEVRGIEAEQPLPEPFAAVRTDSLMGRTFQVRTTLAWSGEDTNLLTVRVSSGDSVSVELHRLFINRSQEASR